MVTIAECRNGMKTFFFKATEGFLERNGILFYWIITMQTYWTIAAQKKTWVWRVWSQPKSSPAQATGRASTYRSWRLSKKMIFLQFTKKANCGVSSERSWFQSSTVSFNIFKVPNAPWLKHNQHRYNRGRWWNGTLSLWRSRSARRRRSWNEWVFRRGHPPKQDQQRLYSRNIR